jgi:hypothetical protein
MVLGPFLAPRSHNASVIVAEARSQADVISGMNELAALSSNMSALVGRALGGAYRPERTERIANLVCDFEIMLRELRALRGAITNAVAD